MAKAKLTSVTVAVALDEDNTRDWYPVKGTSSDPMPELLPHLMHASSYEELTKKVRKRIKAEAKKAGRELSYSVVVSVEGFDPTQPVVVTGAYLVATIALK